MVRVWIVPNQCYLKTPPWLQPDMVSRRSRSARFHPTSATACTAPVSNSRHASVCSVFGHLFPLQTLETNNLTCQEFLHACGNLQWSWMPSRCSSVSCLQFHVVRPNGCLCFRTSHLLGLKPSTTHVMPCCRRRRFGEGKGERGSNSFLLQTRSLPWVWGLLPPTENQEKQKTNTFYNCWTRRPRTGRSKGGRGQGGVPNPAFSALAAPERRQHKTNQYDAQEDSQFVRYAVTLVMQSSTCKHIWTSPALKMSRWRHRCELCCTNPSPSTSDSSTKACLG